MLSRNELVTYGPVDNFCFLTRIKKYVNRIDTINKLENITELLRIRLLFINAKLSRKYKLFKRVWRKNPRLNFWFVINSLRLRQRFKFKVRRRWRFSLTFAKIVILPVLYI